MAKVKPSPVAPVRPAHAQPAPAEVAPEAAVSPLAWWIAFAALGLLALSLLWYPLVRTTARFDIIYNEGWNSYLQQTVANGGKIWAQPPRFTYANYPFLSFEIIGLLGRITHDVNATGRWISLFSFFSVAVLTGLIARRMTGSLRSALYAALVVVIFIAAFKADRIGMNDPHLLGMAFVVFGLYAYVRDPESRVWLRVSAVSIVLGLFVKQSLLAFPAAVAIQLFFTSRRRLVEWLITGTVAAIPLLILSFWLGGPYFLDHLGLPRVFSMDMLLGNVLWYLLIFQTSTIIGLLWCFRRHPDAGSRLVALGFALAVGLAFFFSGGAGADLNHFFDPFVAVAMIGGLLLPAAELAARKTWAPAVFLVVALIVPFYGGTLVMLRSHLAEDAAARAAIPQTEQEFASSVEFVRSHPGPALCESLLLCFEAGKPEIYDAYVVEQLIRTGKVPEREIIKMFDTRQFSTVQILADPNDPIPPATRYRFTANVMSAILRNYRIAMRTHAYAIFVPSS